MTKIQWASGLLAAVSVSAFSAAAVPKSAAVSIGGEIASGVENEGGYFLTDNGEKIYISLHENVKDPRISITLKGE